MSLLETASQLLLAELHRIIDGRLTRTVFQPLVELDSGALVGYEALSRGPAGSVLEQPDQLFAAARNAGRLADLDALCRSAAVAAASRGGLRCPMTLFVNAEPHALGGHRFAPSTLPFHVVLELTERELITHPAELLRTVSDARAAGWGIALDDVGADPASLALLPLVQPDVIKLDLQLVQRRPDAAIAATMHAVHAEAERSGALVVAEGLENARHLQTARAFGATLGQGWMFGRPGALPAQAASPPIDLATLTVPYQPAPDCAGPYQLIADRRTPRTAGKSLLIEASKYLELQARTGGESTLVLSTFQEARFFTPATQRRYRELAERTAFVGVLGSGIAAEPAPGVRGVRLAAADPLGEEWDIVVVGPHFAAALAARDRAEGGPDAQRRFDFVITHERELVVAAAGRLMSRFWTLDPPRAARPPAPRDPVG